MAEYIKRKKTVELLKSLGNREYRREKGTIQDAIKMISYPEYTPTEDVAPIEALERLRDELCEQDLITMEGLKRLNTLIGKYTTVHDGRGCQWMNTLSAARRLKPQSTRGQKVLSRRSILRPCPPPM